MLSNGAVVAGEACVFGIGTLMGLKTGAILGFQTLTLDCETHNDLVKEGIWFTFRRCTSLPFDVVLHGLGHKLTEMPPSSTVRDAAYDVVDHFEFGICDVHGKKAYAGVFEFSKVSIEILIVPKLRARELITQIKLSQDVGAGIKGVKTFPNRTGCLSD